MPLTLLIVGVAALLYWAATPVFVPLVISFALAFLLEPFTEACERRGLGRPAAVLITIVAFTVVVIVVLFALLPAVWHQLSVSATKFPGLVRAAGERLQELLAYAESRLNSDAYARLQATLASASNDPAGIAASVQAWLLTGLAGLVTLGSSALGLLIVPFFVYYLLIDLHAIRAGIDLRIPPRHRAAAARLFDEIGNVLRGYVRGRLLVALGMAVFYTIGLWAVGVPVPVAIGLIAGFVGIVPYLGVVTGLVLAFGFAALDGASLVRLVGVVGVFGAAQLLEDYVLTPRLIGDRLELHPLLVFIGLIVGGDLYGLLGLVLAIPVLAVLKVLVQFFDDLYLSSEFFAAPALANAEVKPHPAQSAMSTGETSTSPSPRGGQTFRPTRVGKKRRA